MQAHKNEYPIEPSQVNLGIDIPDDFQGYNKELFSIAPREQELIDHVLITHGQIKDRCDQLAEQILNDYKGQTLEIMVIMTGAFQFFTDLNDSLIKVRANRMPKTDEEDVIWSYNFQKVSSYKNTESTGIV